MGNEYAPIYFPEIWNNSKYIKYTHNCYEYALDDLSLKEANKCNQNYNQLDNVDSIKKTCRKTNTFSQPGYYAGFGKNNKVTCKNLKNRIMSDNPEPIMYLSNKEDRCIYKYYKIASVADEENNYFHFYRENLDGSWSHKPGSTSATNLDENDDKINNLETANMKVNDNMNYKICNYFCVANNKHLITNSSSIK